MTTKTPEPLEPMQLSPIPRKRGNSFLWWAIGLSCAVHLVFGYFVPFVQNKMKEQVTQNVSVTKIKIPTPPPPTPTPRPTPRPPNATPPPQVPRLKLNVVHTTSNGPSDNTAPEAKYAPPPAGNEQGVPQGQGTAQPVATAPPTPVPTPTPTPHPACAVPNKEATTTRAVEPDVPDIARQQGALGVAQIKVALSATGAVQGVSVYKSTGNSALDQAALAAARAS